MGALQHCGFGQRFCFIDGARHVVGQLDMLNIITDRLQRRLGGEGNDMMAGHRVTPFLGQDQPACFQVPEQAIDIIGLIRVIEQNRG